MLQLESGVGEADVPFTGPMDAGVVHGRGVHEADGRNRAGAQGVCKQTYKIRPVAASVRARAGP